MKSFKQFISEAFSDKEMEVANKTSRSGGAVGSKALVPRHVKALAPADKDHHVLDFGAGKDAVHAKHLKDSGYNVTAHDFGSNVKKDVHDPEALSRKYHTVYASNVLNTQSSKEMMDSTLNQIHGSTHKGGQFIGNFPMSPRKAADIDANHVQAELQKRYKTVIRVGGTKKAPVFHAKDPL